jgi:hypothetical protein
MAQLRTRWIRVKYPNSVSTCSMHLALHSNLKDPVNADADHMVNAPIKHFCINSCAVIVRYPSSDASQTTSSSTVRRHEYNHKLPCTDFKVSCHGRAPDPFAISPFRCSVAILLQLHVPFLVHIGAGVSRSISCNDVPRRLQEFHLVLQLIIHHFDGPPAGLS